MLKLKDMSGPAVGQFEKIRLKILRNIVFLVVLFELLHQGDQMRALAQFFPHLEAILIGLVDRVEFVHQIHSSVL